MLVSALYHLPLGILGLLADRTFPIGSSATTEAGSGFVLGVFETNGWHSLAALLLGVVSAYYVLRPRGARSAALVIGLGHVALFVALAVWPPETFWLASNGADQVIHGTTAVAATTAALLTRPAHVSRRSAA